MLRKLTLLVAIVGTMGLCGCQATFEPDGDIKVKPTDETYRIDYDDRDHPGGGPPSHAPAHGRRNK